MRKRKFTIQLRKKQKQIHEKRPRIPLSHEKKHEILGEISIPLTFPVPPPVPRFGREAMQSLPSDFLFGYQQRTVARFASAPGLVCYHMGVGKTRVGTGILVNHYVRDKDWPTSIVVAPEASMHAFLAENTTLRRQGVNLIFTELRGASVPLLEASHVVFTTYGFLRTAWSAFHEGKRKSKLDTDVQHWLWEKVHGLVLLDEAQFICNAKTHANHAVMHLQAQHYVGLTGTPIQNSETDLVSLRKFLRLGAGVPIHEFISLETHETSARETGRAPIRVSRYNLTSGFQSKEERDFHRLVLDRLAERLQINACEPEEPSTQDLSSTCEEAGTRSRGRGSVFTALMKARQACLVPALADPELEGHAWATTHSTKINMLMYYLRKYTGRIVIMTFFVSAFPYIHRRLEMEGIGPVLEYSKNLKPKERQAVLETWKKESGLPGGPRILLATIGTAGVSLNLPAERLILLESMYNPQRQKQAAARITRIGGVTNCTITTTMILGTIEECISVLAHRKTELAQRLIEGSQIDAIETYILQPLETVDNAARQLSPLCDEEEESAQKARGSDTEIANPKELTESERVDVLLENHGKILTNLMETDVFQSMSVLHHNPAGSSLVSLSPDDSMKETATWNYTAYQRKFLVFDTLEVARGVLEDVFHTRCDASTEHELGELHKSIWNEKDVAGIWLAEQKHFIVFFPGVLLSLPKK